MKNAKVAYQKTNIGKNVFVIQNFIKHVIETKTSFCNVMSYVLNC